MSKFKFNRGKTWFLAEGGLLRGRDPSCRRRRFHCHGAPSCGAMLAAVVCSPRAWHSSACQALQEISTQMNSHLLVEERRTTPGQVRSAATQLMQDHWTYQLTSMMVRLFRRAMATHFSSSKATRHTASP